MSKVTEAIGRKFDQTRAGARKSWALLPTTAQVVGEVAAEDRIRYNEQLQTDVMAPSAAAFLIDANLTIWARGLGINTERVGVRRSINFISASLGALANLAYQGRLEGDGETVTPPGVSAAVIGATAYAGAWLGNSAGRALTR